MIGESIGALQAASWPLLGEGIAWAMRGIPSAFRVPSRVDAMADPSLPVYEWDDPEKYELLAWVKASERRVDVLSALSEAPKNTNDFADAWGVELETVRYHLKQLKHGGPDGDLPALVQVLTPDRQQYRLYGLTETGVDVIKFL